MRNCYPYLYIALFHLSYMLSLGCCVGSNPNLLFVVMRCLENLSSGENLAGCADTVCLPFGSAFLSVYTRLPSASRWYMRCMVLRFQNDLSKVIRLLTFSFFLACLLSFFLAFFLFFSLSLFVSSSFLYVFLPSQCDHDGR